MYGLFTGLEIGKRALISSQLAMNTVGHNMANANTPGYSRQRVNISSTNPAETAWGNAGTGVEVTSIQQIRDLFLSGQYRNENGSMGSWEFTEKSVAQVEGFFNEPQENSLGSALDDFWQSWSAVAGNSDDNQARNDLLNKANVLVNNMHQIDRKLSNLRQTIDSEIRTSVADLNQVGSQIAVLNRQIISMEVAGDKANDLRDQRDNLIDTLSGYLDVSTIEKSNGSVTVAIGAMAFVEGDTYQRLGTETVKDGESSITKVVWERNKAAVNFKNGTFGSMLHARDEMITTYQSELDTLARGIVENVNALHTTGFTLDNRTDIFFFDPTAITAGTIKISDDVLGNPDMIAAASAVDKPADGSIAEAISVMINSSRVMRNSTTIREFYGSIVGRLGTESMEATDNTENFKLLVEQIENQRQSVQGVSLDEEMTNLVRYQSAYEAAARVITVMDEALDTLINGTGIVGR